MPDFRTGLIAGALIATAAFVVPTLAHAHAGKAASADLMTVVEANGRVEQVRNATPIAPRGAGAVVAQSPFAMMNQMAAQMNAQMNAMMRQAQVAQTSGAQNTPAGQNVSAGAAPAGVCMQSVQVIERAGQEPQVVRRQSGDCSAAPATPTAPQAPQQQQHAPAAPPAPRDSI